MEGNGNDTLISQSGRRYTVNPKKLRKGEDKEHHNTPYMDLLMNILYTYRAFFFNISN